MYYIESLWRLSFKRKSLLSIINKFHIEKKLDLGSYESYD